LKPWWEDNIRNTLKKYDSLWPGLIDLFGFVIGTRAVVKKGNEI